MRAAVSLLLFMMVLLIFLSPVVDLLPTASRAKQAAIRILMLLALALVGATWFHLRWRVYSSQPKLSEHSSALPIDVLSLNCVCLC